MMSSLTFHRPLLNYSKINVKRLFSIGQRAEKTPLYDFHVENGGKMVNFGGFLLPVQYSDLSIANSHLFTRNNASIFDVSHMLQTEIKGKKCVDFFESLCPADIQGLKENAATLTVFTDETGGILDDLIVTKVNQECLHVVSNAAMKKQDQAIMLNGLKAFKKRHETDIQIRFLDEALIALQGPRAASILQNFTDIDLSTLYFMNTIMGNIEKVPNCRITRCGYTGEDGFELSIPPSEARKIVEILTKSADVKLAGLGARDSLRLEAGLCLYGSDIDAHITPVEAALTWLVAKRRREQGNFPGAAKIMRQIHEGSRIKRIGITSKSGPPARQGAKILSERGEFLGDITSGCPSPSLNLNVAMGYVPLEFTKSDLKVGLEIRGKTYEGLVTKMPFVKANYYNKPKIKQ